MAEPKQVLIIGAGGKLGRRLVARAVAHGHAVTAFVRDAPAFVALAGHGSAVRVVAGDVFDDTALADAMAAQDAVVSAAGTVGDGDAFVRLFGQVVDVAERTLGDRVPVWMLGGTAVLTIPFANRIAIGLPGVPKLYRPHAVNWRRLEQSRLDWSLMCPGPMIAAPADAPLPVLRVSRDVMPFDVPRWAGWAPGVALALLMKAHLSELVAPYEAVADAIIGDLERGRATSRHRVGVALDRRAPEPD